MPTYRIIIFLSLCILTGCARKSTTQQFAGLVELSSAQSTYQHQNFEVSFHNAVFYQGEIAIDVHIQNNSDAAMTIQPGEWSYLVNFSSDFGQADAQLDYLINPTQRVEELKAAHKMRKNRWWSRPIAGLLKFSAAAAAANYLNTENLVSEGAVDVLSTPVEAGQNMKEKKDLNFWKEVILQPATLAPGEAVNGLVFFNHYETAGSYELFFTLGDEPLRHVVQQMNL